MNNAYIDKIFRHYGEDSLGKECMDKITDSQVETARCWACNELHELTKKYGKRTEGTVKELFCDYVIAEYL